MFALTTVIRITHPSPPAPPAPTSPVPPPTSSRTTRPLVGYRAGLFAYINARQELVTGRQAHAARVLPLSTPITALHLDIGHCFILGEDGHAAYLPFEGPVLATVPHPVPVPEPVTMLDSTWYGMYFMLAQSGRVYQLTALLDRIVPLPVPEPARWIGVRRGWLYIQARTGGEYRFAAHHPPGQAIVERIAASDSYRAEPSDADTSLSSLEHRGVCYVTTTSGDGVASTPGMIGTVTLPGPIPTLTIPDVAGQSFQSYQAIALTFVGSIIGGEAYAIILTVDYDAYHITYDWKTGTMVHGLVVPITTGDV